MPNTFAFLALLGWPAISAFIFFQLRFERAIIWSVVASFLFLPSSFGIDLPGLPPLDKASVSNLTVLAITIVLSPGHFRFLPVTAAGKLLVLLMIVVVFLTSITNQDPIWTGGELLRGLSLYDAISNLVRTIITIIPFLIGCQYLSSVGSHRDILKILLVSGLFYSLLMLFEIRMSPQLHTWVYGFFPHSILQQFRGDGFRPVVFLVHGLWAAFFAMTVTVAAAALWRDSKGAPRASSEAAIRPLYLYATAYLGVVLVLCKSLGSLLFGIASVPLVLLTKPKTQLGVAVVLVLVALAYPALRGAHLVPVQTLLDFAKSIDADRAESLQTRLDHEEQLLARAEERPLFGWGGWGRNRIYDPETGQDISITDGYWVIVIGATGWVGYIATFGLLALPVLAVWRRMRRQNREVLTPVTSALCLLIGVNMIELLPNSTLPPWTWLIAGALLGFAARTEDAGVERPEEIKGARPRTIL